MARAVKRLKVPAFVVSILSGAYGALTLFDPSIALYVAAAVGTIAEITDVCP
jgi:hypothetical protein